MNVLNQQVSEAIDNQRENLAATIVAREFVRHPELERRFGKAGREKCLQDAGYHLSYLSQAIATESVELFSNYIGWAKIMLAKRGVPAQDLTALLETMKESLEEGLAPEMSTVACDYLNTGLRLLPQFPDDIPSFITEDAPLGPLASRYLEALLRGERHISSQLILEAASQGTPVQDIYLYVFQRCQYEIGRLWQVNQISVAQEHYCTAAAQLIMSQLYSYIFGGDKTRGTLVATCVAGDLHEIGARMVSDLFEKDGWRTHYLGANVPSGSVVQTLIQHRATVLAISATISYHIRAVESLIATVRRAPECRDVKILVGGYPFKLCPTLWKMLGADGFAADAPEAIALANRLTNQSFAA